MCGRDEDGRVGPDLQLGVRRDGDPLTALGSVVAEAAGGRTGQSQRLEHIRRRRQVHALAQVKTHVVCP